MRSWSQLRRSVGAQAASVPEVVADEHRYRDHRLVLAPQGEGWRIDVYADGARMPELVISSLGDPAGEDVALDDAKQAIDQLLEHGLTSLKIGVNYFQAGEIA